jgi:hypothetical protein
VLRLFANDATGTELIVLTRDHLADEVRPRTDHTPISKPDWTENGGEWSHPDVRREFS